MSKALPDQMLQLLICNMLPQLLHMHRAKHLLQVFDFTSVIMFSSVRTCTCRSLDPLAVYERTVYERTMDGVSVAVCGPAGL